MIEMITTKQIIKYWIIGRQTYHVMSLHKQKNCPNFVPVIKKFYQQLMSSSL